LTANGGRFSRAYVERFLDKKQIERLTQRGLIVHENNRPRTTRLKEDTVVSLEQLRQNEDS
jgi:hypothetical protein